MAPDPTANFCPSWLHFTVSAARLIRRITSDGFHSPSSPKVHTNALRSWLHVTILFVAALQSMPLTSRSCSARTYSFFHCLTSALAQPL